MSATHIRPGDTGPHRIPPVRAARRGARPRVARIRTRSRRWVGISLVAGVAAFLGGFGIGGANSRSRPAAAPADPVVSTTVGPTTSASITTTTTSTTSTTVPVSNELPAEAPSRLVAVSADGQSLLSINPRSGESTVLDQVADYGADGVRQFGRVSLSPDGAWVFYAALVDPSSSGRIGYTLRTSTSGDSEPRRIADGVAPAVSHDGSQLVTVRGVGDALLITDLEASASERRKPLRWTDNGRIDHPTWAPDGSAIIFEQWQGSQSDLWLFPIEENGPLQNDSSRLVSDRDRSWRQPVWKADGGNGGLLAIERCCLDDQFKGVGRAVSMDPLAGDAIRQTVAEVPNAAASELFVDASGAFLLQIDGSGQLRWLAPDGAGGTLIIREGEGGVTPAFASADW